MQVKPTTQPATPPPNKPVLASPVSVKLDVPVYYLTDRGPVKTLSGLTCTRRFAESVLSVLDAWAKRYNFALVHLGLYNPRMARHRDGTPIKPERWSNHAFGEAIDLAGIITKRGDGEYLDMDALRAGSPAKYKEVIDLCRAVITTRHARPEIVDEGQWEHIGIFHEG